ncbi:transcription factor EMB1444-like [Hibiscus syriacus]|uniref:transcription factor EMB1444-like n=1 Tax=Hibiscus syriacus TaxID=106335 RepID=UPI0019242162|nr:transcription factor EMB1444-like [Hibiscus syriacus]
MTTTVLKQLLKSFCTNSPWTYAMLWKLRHSSPMGLTWEDEYCVYPIPTEILPSQFETSIDDCYFLGFPIGLVVPNILNLKYAWGEGVVGIVVS